MKSKRIKIGQSAPFFRVEDIFGNMIDLKESREKLILLSFFRYASCPLCNLRIRELIKQNEQLVKSGIVVIAVFQSPQERVLHYVGRQQAPFTIIPDPQRRLYRLYGVESSWGGFLLAWTAGIPKVFSAVLGNGFIPGTVEGELNRIPADFLIDTDGIIIEAYYGNDIGDHVPIDRVIKISSNYTHNGRSTNI